MLQYMGIGVLSEGGGDAHDYEWVAAYRDSAQAA